MIRKRISSRDDPAIVSLIERLLLPYTRKTIPDATIGLKSLRKRLTGSMTYIAQAAGGETAGFVTLKKRQHMMLVDMLAVHPRHQGRGFGSRLMDKAERTAKLLGCTELSLWVDESNPRAQTFYTLKGYAAVHYEKRIRCYLMTKRI